MGARILEGAKFRHSIAEKTIGQFFFNSAEKNKDRVCQIDASIDKSEAYDSVKRRSIRVAMELQHKGISSSDIIAFCSGNTLDNTIPLLASFYIGAKVANLEPTLSVERTKHLLSLITPKMIFVDEASVTLIEQSLMGVDFHTEIVVFGNSKKYSIFSDYVKTKKNEAKFKPANVDPEDVALIIFTSGTTDMPKPVSHSHRSFLCNILRVYHIGEGISTFHCSTFFWFAAYVVLGTCFKKGSYRVFGSDTNPEKICALTEKYMISLIFAGNVVIHKLANFKNVKKYDTSSLKILVIGGVSTPLSHLEALVESFPTARVMSTYALVETGLISGFDMEIDVGFIQTHLCSCGKVVAESQLKVVGVDSRKMLGPNEKGEICVKSSSMMVGYYKGDNSPIFDEQGFFKTGDIGYYDKDNCIYVTERLKEMIKYQEGYVIPSIIEAVLVEHPAIKEAVVVGLPHEKLGEVPAACIVLKEGYHVTEKDVDKFLKEKKMDRERLRGGVKFLSSLPRTPTEKIDRQEVRDLIFKRKI